MVARQTSATGQKVVRKKPAKVVPHGHGDRTVTPGDVGEPLLYNIRQAAGKLGMSFSIVERLVASGELFSVKAGGRRLIPAWATVAYVRDLCQAHDRDGRYAAEYDIAG